MPPFTLGLLVYVTVICSVVPAAAVLWLRDRYLAARTRAQARLARLDCPIRGPWWCPLYGIEDRWGPRMENLVLVAIDVDYLIEWRAQDDLTAVLWLAAVGVRHGWLLLAVWCHDLGVLDVPREPNVMHPWWAWLTWLRPPGYLRLHCLLTHRAQWRHHWGRRSSTASCLRCGRQWWNPSAWVRYRVAWWLCRQGCLPSWIEVAGEFPSWQELLATWRHDQRSRTPRPADPS